MSYYMSMQSVRFRSPNDYERFKMLFANVAKHLEKIDGFIHLTCSAVLARVAPSMP